nr:alpha/beta fold hydrolase [Thalassococcus arenae]
MVHGFMGGSGQWALQQPLGDDRRLIAVDLPGFGQNAAMAPLPDIPAYAAWVLDEVTRQGIDRFDLLGHSMGGMIVQDMVRQAPDRVARLVLYSTGAKGLLPGRFEPIETSMQRARDDGAAATARRIAATWFLQGDAAAQFPDCAAIAERSSLAAILAGLGAMRDWSGENHLAAIGVPTLVLWGDGDRTYPWAQIERLWRTIPGASLAVLPGCAHAVHMERPGLFNRLVSDFLSDGSSTG